jgi:hypothetical protein|tara:strand:+ start:1201 stop:3876 length:2676 start_codon:yes stop_codon:yes gene_type:complete
MKKKILFTIPLLVAFFLAFMFLPNKSKEKITITKLVVKKKKTLEQRALYAKERELYEYNLQVNPITGKIPQEEKEKELSVAKREIKLKSKNNTSNTYALRGPSNLGGRTRALVIDVSDTTSKTIIAGGVSSGVFRTTNGGTSWVKVSSNDEIHNVTAIAQDPRNGFQNIWYYATGEMSGNSASLGSAYRGQGVWKSIDGGLNWSQIAATNSLFELSDSSFDYINALAVNPLNGNLFIAATGKIYRYDGTNMSIELEIPFNGTGFTDVKIASNGRVFASIVETSTAGGVWTSLTGNGSWTQIASNGSLTGWSSAGRIVLGVAPSNANIVYALYVNGNSGAIEGDLWKYKVSTNSWTNFSSKLPDEAGGDSEGNDPFAIQGGYDLVVSVKPNDENFVVIGGTNIYKISNIETSSTFTRIGGYLNNLGYNLYNVGGTVHHPDIHQLVFDPQNPNILYSGTDGGIHKADATASNVAWQSLNNNYQTYQYYHVAMHQKGGSDMVIGGAQDNGTTVGGTGFGLSDKTTMTNIAGGDGVAVALGDNGINAPLIYLGVQKGPIYRRKAEYEEITPQSSVSEFVTYFYLDPDNNNALYYAGKNKLYRTIDAENVTKTTWTDLGALSKNELISTIATTRGAYTASSYLYIGGQRGGVYRVKDPQNITSLSTSDVNITPAGASTSIGAIVSDIAVHPTNPDIVLAVYANYGINNIYLTSNATAATPTWTLVERNLNNHSVRSASIAQVDSEIIYFVGTARGLYSSSDPTAKDWTIEGGSNIGLAVVSSLVYRPSDKKLLIGTHGNGMFETTVQKTLSTNSYNEKDLGITLFPNPTVDKISIKSSFLQGNSLVFFEIYDLKGSLIKRGKLLNQQINVNDLKTGVYFLNVKSENKKQTLKFIKK